MKRLLPLLIVLLPFCNYTFAQNQNQLTELQATINASDFGFAKEDLTDFLEKSKAIVSNQQESNERIYVEAYLNKASFDEISTSLPRLGFVTSKEVSTRDNSENIEKTNLEIKYLKDKKASYETEISAMDKKDERYYNYWEEIRSIEKKIFNLELENQSKNKQNNYKIVITIRDESVDLASDNISWVNMPGASFDLFWVENPVSDLSAEMYMGYSLKYLFTRGKSYATLGVLKNYADEPANASMFNELFMFGFGQDFYTRHFGRGKNKFFNLYTGYNVGGTFATADTRSTILPYSKLFLGVELFKNKYILLDNKVGYFVPFKYNRNLRGITYNVSFNFVF